MSVETFAFARVPLRRNRDFVLLWTGQAISLLGSRITSIAIPLLVLAVTGSPAKMGIVGFFGTLPYLLVQLPAGGLVDRLDRKRTMIVCDAVRAVALTSIPVAIWAGRIGIPQLAGVAFVEGTMAVVFGLAENAALPRVVPPFQLTQAIAQNEARERGAALAGQPLGGLLFQLAHAVPFAADAVSYAVSMITLVFIRTSMRVERQAERASLRREIREGFSWLWHHGFLRASALLIAGSNFIFQGVVLAVVVVGRSRGASSAEIGLIFLLSGVGGLAGAMLAPRIARTVPTRGVIVGVTWLWAAILPIMALPIRPIALGPLFGAMTLVGPAWNVVFGTYELTLVPDRLLGRVQSVEMLLSWGAIPLGSLAAGLLLQQLGPSRAMIAFAALMAAIAILGTLSPSLRHAPPLPRDGASEASPVAAS
jgi:MFS family permease